MTVSGDMILEQVLPVIVRPVASRTTIRKDLLTPNSFIHSFIRLISMKDLPHSRQVWDTYVCVCVCTHEHIHACSRPEENIKTSAL